MDENSSLSSQTICDHMFSDTKSDHTFHIFGYILCRTMGSREHYFVNTLTLVAYQGKPVSLPPEIITQGTMFDHVLTVYNSISDNENRLKP